MLGLLCRGGWMKACIAPGNPSCGCGSHAERAQVDGFDTPLEPSVRATNVGVLGPSRACHCCDDRSGAAVASQGEGRAATADGRGRPCTGQAAPSPKAQMVWPSICVVTSISISISRLCARPSAMRMSTRHIQPMPSRQGVHCRSWGAPRGRVALEAATGLRGETGVKHALRLRAQELRPAGADPARRRPEARDAQQGRDRGRRDVDSELQQLAPDAHIAPARVLPRQPEDQTACLGRKRRTTRPAAAPSAFALQQGPVPAAERPRADREARPPLGWKQPARRRKQRTVSGRVTAAASFRASRSPPGGAAPRFRARAHRRGGRANARKRRGAGTANR